MINKRFFTNKLYYQGVAKINLNRFFNQSSRYFFFKQDNVYQNNSQYRQKQLLQVEITVKMKNFKFELNEREFDKNDRNRKFDRNKKNYDRKI